MAGPYLRSTRHTSQGTYKKSKVTIRFTMPTLHYCTKLDLYYENVAVR